MSPKTTVPGKRARSRSREVAPEGRPDDEHARYHEDQGELRTQVPCCPDFGTDCPCDVLDFHYRLVHRPQVSIEGRRQTVPVEVKIHVRFERCPGPLALGDLVYSTTLFPGEKVHLFSSDRRTRFSYDAVTKISYHHEQLSEERFFMASLHDFMSDVEVRDASSASSQSQSNWAFDSGASGWVLPFAGGASVGAKGSHNSASTRDFLRELRAHAESSERRAVIMTRAVNSVSVGEVQTRVHTEGESEDHFESASRVFANSNRCRAITFYFYQINKTQTIRFSVESIERRVIDPAADTAVTNNPPKVAGGVTVIPAGVLATDIERTRVEATGRVSVAAERQGALAVSGIGPSPSELTFGRSTFSAPPDAVAGAQPLSAEVRDQALLEVDKGLAAAGLLDKPGADARVPAETLRTFSFERCSSLPSPGLFVRGCLDDCSLCEPELERQIELELQRKDLENRLLARQIELLEQAQEYRCCPPRGEEG